MFMASMIKSIFDQVENFCINMDMEIQDFFVRQESDDRFVVKVGEIHLGGVYVLRFNRDKLLEIYHEILWNGKIVSEQLANGERPCP